MYKLWLKKSKFIQNSFNILKYVRYIITWVSYYFLTKIIFYTLYWWQSTVYCLCHSLRIQMKSVITNFLVKCCWHKNIIFNCIHVIDLKRERQVKIMLQEERNVWQLDMTDKSTPVLQSLSLSFCITMWQTLSLIHCQGIHCQVLSSSRL